MLRKSPSRFLRWIGGTALLATFATPLPATITDDITPFGHLVSVVLSNPKAESVSGVVTVSGIVASRVVTSSVEFRVAAGSRTEVIVPFDAKVSGVLSVSITEGPDPIPR